MAEQTPGPAALLLKARLEKLEWSQAELARVLGVTIPTVCRWLAGTRSPSLDMAFRIQNSKIAIPAEAWITHADADESGEHPAVVAPPRSETG